VRFSILTALAGLLASVMSGQVNTLSSFATFAQQPQARVIWSTEVDRLESRDSHALVTALVVENSSQPSERMRGVRIDFSWSDKKSTIYIGEILLQPEKAIFDGLTLDVARGGVLPGFSGLGFIGSCEFRDNPDLYPLVADFNSSGPDAPALRIIVGPKEQILFRGLTPSHLSRVLGDAINELKAH
jgi:hypothetical protein